MNLTLIKLIEEKFKQKLSEKTGWGRNEVMIILKDCINESVLELLDKKD